MLQDSRAVHQTEFIVHKEEEEELFEMEIRAVVQTALPDAVSWDELLEETSQDQELKELKSAIALHQNSKPLGPSLTQPLQS